MSRTVQISIDGSAILYLRDFKWHVVFIVDQKCHDLKFEDPENDHSKRFGKHGTNQIMEFSAAKGVIYPFATRDDNVLAEFMNLVHLHGSHLKVKPNPKKGRHWVHMTVPFGTVRVIENAPYNYCYRELPNGPCRLLRTGPAAKFEFKFELEEGAVLRMHTANEDGSNSVTTDYDTNTSGKLRLKFDNRCEENMGYNDSIHIYDWVEDDNAKQYEWGSCGAVCGHQMLDSPNPDSISDEQMAKFAKERELAHKWDRSPDGDCDPVVIDPPPPGP